MLVRKDFLNRADALQRIVERSPRFDLALDRRDYRLCRTSTTQERIAFEAMIHSHRLEHPDWVKGYDPKTVGKARRLMRQKDKEESKKLHDAWLWLKQAYEGPSEDIVKTVAARVRPEIHQGDIAEYRTENVRLSGFENHPPRWEKVPGEMEQLIKKVEDNAMHPIAAAGYLHFHIARIQPVLDGNKRTSRLIHTAHLHNYGFPPAIIESGSRRFYHELFDSAHGAYKLKCAEGSDKVSPEEKILFNFFAYRVIVSLETMIDSLRRK